jgi:hypothetical protein
MAQHIREYSASTSATGRLLGQYQPSTRSRRRSTIALNRADGESYCAAIQAPLRALMGCLKMFAANPLLCVIFHMSSFPVIVPGRRARTDVCVVISLTGSMSDVTLFPARGYFPFVRKEVILKYNLPENRRTLQCVARLCLKQQSDSVSVCQTPSPRGWSMHSLVHIGLDD